MKLIKGLLIGLGLLFLVIIIMPTSKEDVMDREFSNAYMEGCMSDRGEKSRSYCQCTLDYMNDNMTNKEFVDSAFEYTETGRLPKKSMDAVYYCLDLYEY